MSQLIKFKKDTVRVQVSVQIAVAYQGKATTPEDEAQRQVTQHTFNEQARLIEKDLVELINEKGLPTGLVG